MCDPTLSYVMKSNYDTCINHLENDNKETSCRFKCIHCEMQ